MENPATAVFASHSTALASNLRIGVDIARIAPIEASLAEFGTRFLRRIFSDDEAAYAMQVPAQTGQRLTARFAAKEAAMKAFGLSEAGVAWRDIEVRRGDDGACTLALHGRAAEAAVRSGSTEIALSLSHDGDHAIAMVVAAVHRPAPTEPSRSTAPRPFPNALQPENIP